MSTLATPRRVEALWYTRCPVPTASSIAIDHGLLDQEFANDAIEVSSLRASDVQKVRESHFNHSLPDSFREGGNIPPIWTRSRGGKTRVIAANWVDEYQAIIAMPEADIQTVVDLKGRRLGVPRRLNDEIDYWRAMCLRAYSSALQTAGLWAKDVEFVDVPIAEKYISSDKASRSGTLWNGAHRARRQQADAFALIRGTADAIYTAGAPGAQLSAFLGAREVINLRIHPDPLVRINNQVPNILTISQQLLDDRPDIVDRYLARLVAAGQWARHHRSDCVRIIANDVGATEEWVDVAYGADFADHLVPGLEDRQIEGLRAQKAFLLAQGFIESDFDLDAWIDSGPLDRLGIATGTARRS